MKIILSGAGDIGEYLASQYSMRHDVVIIDSDQKVLDLIEKKIDVMPFHGNSSHQPVLEKVGVAGSGAFIAVTGSDEVNMLSASLAHKLGSTYSIARIDSPEFYTDENQGIVRGTLGITSAVCSSRLISIELQRKWRASFSTFIRNYAENNICVFSYEITSDFSFFNKNIQDINIGKNVKIAAVIRDNVLQDPTSVSSLYEGDSLIVVSTIFDYQKTMEKLDSKHKTKKVLVIGGGDVGGGLALDLDNEGHDVRVFDKNETQCDILVQKTRGIEIIHGDGTDMNLLEDQKVNFCDVIFSVTKADEVNLMSCLISKEMGIKHSFSLVHRPNYSSIYHRLGITGTTSTPDLFHEAIDYLTGTDYLTHNHEILDSNGHVYEIYIPAGTLKSELRLSDLNLTENVIFCCAYGQKELHFENNPMFKEEHYYVFLSSLNERNFMALFKGLKK
jgi:trk system potassium uptake protein TrkA